jgi:hypothetical protein
MVYGWMPRVLRLNANSIARAVGTLRRAQAANEEACDTELIRDVAACLSSTVGASKLLHFVNPEIFPIWDSNVERIRCGTTPSQHHMQQTRHYLAYFREVHACRRMSGFADFFGAFERAYRERLVRLRIDPYHVTEVRGIESAAFELSGSDDEGA